MAKGTLPLTYFGKVIGTAIIEDNGEIHAQIDQTVLTKEERDRILGRTSGYSIAVVQEE